MAIDKNYGIKPGSYFPTGDSYNRLTAPYESSPPFIQINRDYEHDMKLDIDLLQRSTYQTKAIYNSVAGQVFGSLQQQEYVNLRHQANLMRERIKLHHRHLYDIDHRHLHVQELLFGVKINHNPEKAKRQSTLEGQLLQLEGQRRDEELGFWKDTVELREKLFDRASDYKANKSRYDIFSSIELGDNQVTPSWQGLYWDPEDSRTYFQNR